MTQHMKNLFTRKKKIIIMETNHKITWIWDLVYKDLIEVVMVGLVT